MRLSQEQIRRMIDGRGGSGGGGGGSLDPSALAGYATQAWTEENYISKTFFNELFVVHKKVTTVVMDGETEISRTVTTNSVFAPNEIPGTTTETDETTGYVTTVTTEISSIEAKKGFWTNYFISALGLNSEGGGGGLTLNEPLATINVSGLANHPSSSGQTIVWNGSAWVYGTAGGGTGTVTGVKVGDITYSPVNGIVSIPAYPTSLAWSAITSKPTTIAGYGITDAKIENGVITLGSNTITPLTSSAITDMATKTWVGQQGFALASNVYSKTDADAKFMTIAAFENLFNALNSSDQKVSHPYSSGVASIKAMVGLWTEQYLSALGKSDSGGEIVLNEPLNSINNAGLAVHPSTSGQTIVWNGTAWTYGTAGGIGMTYTFATGDANGQFKVTPSSGAAYNVNIKGLAALAYKASLAVSDIPDLSGRYLPLTGGTMTGAITRNSGGWWAKAREHAIIRTTASNSDTYYAAFSLKTVNGDWSVGVKADTDKLYAIYTTDTEYEAGSNNPVKIMFPQTSGTLAMLTDNIASATKLYDDNPYTAWGQTFFTGGKPKSISNTYMTGVTNIDSLLYFDTTNNRIGVSKSSPSYAIDVNGTAQATTLRATDIYIGGIHITADNNGIHINSAGLYADTYVSALGLSDSGGSGGIDWDALAANTNEQINVSHLTTALAPYALTSQIPTSLRNPYKLTITLNGTATEYDGSAARSLTINTGLDQQALTTYLSSKILTIKNGTATLGTWNPTAAGTIDIASAFTDVVRHKDVGTGSVDAMSGSFFFGGVDALQSGYDYVGFQAGNSADKWQMTAIGSLRWRQNDNGGTDSSNWGDWRTILDTSNWTSTINLSSLGAASASELNNYLPLSAGSNKPLTGSLYLSSLSKGVFVPYTVDGSTVNIPLIYDNGANLWIGATQTTGTHHVGATCISAGTGEVYISRLVSGTRTNYKVLDKGNTYVSSGNGYIDGSEITTISGNAGTASRLQGSGTYTAWGQTYWTSGVPQSILGDIRMLPSGGNTNSDSAKIDFRTLSGDDYVYAPYIQAINIAPYGLKRLSVFQKSQSDWTTAQTEVFTIWPTGTVGINTSSPNTNYKLDVNGYTKTFRLYLSDTIYMEVANNGVHIVGGGLYADTYVSALGLSDSSGPAFDEPAMWQALGTTITEKQISSTYLTNALAPYALKTDIPTLKNLSWSYGSVTSASGNSYNGSTARSFVIPKATSHLTNDSGFITSSELGNYLPLSAGSSKPLTGSLYLNGRGMGIFMPYTISGSAVNIPLIYDNGSNLWIGSTATASTHHLGSTYISAGTTGNGTIYVSVPNADNNNASNYGVLHIGNYSTTLDTRYVTLSTSQRITGEKKFNYPYGMVMDRDTSNYKNISRVFASNGTTQIGYIGYINTTQRMFLSSQDNTDPWTDTIGKYQLMLGVNELTYNTYNILHAGNSSISGSTVTINGTSIDAVRYLYDASSEWKETSGTFFFGGTGVLKSGYDYVGIQAGNNVDKWQIVGIDGLQWRQNDSGGTNTANWTDWRTFIDSSNYTNYVKPKYYLSRKSLSSKGWYRVADVKQYGTSFLLTICGNYNNSGPATPVTYLVSHSYTTDDIRQVGGCATIGHVNAVRVVRYASGKIYIDIYYSVDVANGIGVEITPLDEKSSWLSSSIDMIDFESVSSSVPSGQTLVDTKYVNKTGLEGIYTMNGGQQGPGYFGKSAVGFLMSNQSINGDSSYKNWIYMDNYFGTDAGGTTAIGVSRSSGRMFVMRSDANRTSWNTLREVVVADSDTGNVGIGKGNTAASYKLEVNGTAKVTSLRIGSIEIIEDTQNGGLRIVSGGLSADTYISALGVGQEGGGSGTDLETVWASMREVVGPSSNHTIDVSHISAAMSSYLTSNSYATQTWVNNKGYATQTWVNQQGFVTSAGITSITVSVPTGLKVNSKSSDTLTSNGTFALTFTDGYSIPTSTKQGQWDAAYTNSHTHSNKSVLDGITSGKVSNWDSAYSTVNTIGGYFTDGSANTAVKLKTPRAINGTNFDGSAAITTTKWGTARNISIADADITNTGTAVSVDGSSAMTLKLPSTIKATLSGNATSATTASKLSVVSKTAWGQTYWTSGGVPADVSGSIEAGNSGGYIGGFDHIDLNTHASLQGYGGYIDFYYNGANSYTSRIIEEESGVLSIKAPNVAGLLVGGYNGDYVQIGQIRIVYESSNNALRIENANGAAANLYALGGISALGMSGNADGTISGNLVPNASGTYNLGSSTYKWNNLYVNTANVNGITLGKNVSGYGVYLNGNDGTGFSISNSNNLGLTARSGNISMTASSGKVSVTATKMEIGGTNSNSDMLYVNGTVRASSYNNSSDARLKNIISNENIDIETIARAPIVRFTWKNADDPRVHWGTLAQYWRSTEIGDIVEDGEYLAMDYAATALAGVISVARKVMTHEERIAALEAENERLRNEIETLKAA